MRALEDGTEQIVNLGAGLDSRAYRLTGSWGNGRVFEIDFPSTQEYKKRKVASVFGAPPRNLTYVPIDFTRQSLEHVLPSHGYRAGAKTLFIWEGVTLYLPKDAVQSTLAFVARTAGPGSSIIFDYQDERTVSQDCDDEVWRKWAKLSVEWGEPWKFGIPLSGDGNVLQLVAGQGLEVKSDYTMGELCVKHLPPTIVPATFGLDRWAWRVCHATQRSSS
jgi:methyltransferase (TIGR00027 family)